MNKDTMLLLISIVIETTTACAPRGHSPQLQISGFETQVNAFQEASLQTEQPTVINDLIIQLDDTIAAQGENGVCMQATNMTPVIKISTSYWNNASDQGKEALVFHELGHCILNRGHVTALNTQGIPASIMFPCAGVYDSSNPTIAATCNGIRVNNFNDEIYYQQHRNDYIQELFNQ